MKVIIVGSGIVGSSAAYHLARKGAEVIIVDKFHQGQATAAGAGIVCPWISKVENPDWYALANRGAGYYPTLITDLKEDGESGVGYSLVGAIAVSNDPNELNDIEQKVRRNKEDRKEVGEISRLTSKEAQTLFPPLRDDLEAVHVTGGARVDGRLLTNALLRAAEKHGAILHTGEASIIVTNNKVTGIQLNGDVISADSIIVTAGAWSKQLLSPLGIDLQVEPQRGQIAHLKLQDDQDTSKWPVVLPQSSHYLVSFDDSRVVVGATRETGSGFDYRVTAAGIKEIMEEALLVAPGLSDSTLHDVRIGFRPAGPDILPLLGTISSLDGLVIATGLGASGLTLGPYVGLLAGDLALGEEIELDLTPYNPLRDTLVR
ncbi:NAD(P)/FAD-dependent oxidoreductase [Pseudalkalibacillus decolorationis]|uniref:NAD(P)/FAD-dependent oxidoreductase n=1 Tax=Pseudalkalibacillus decolorationis TaxID=163879 RepID=UPI002148CDB9|nr:FAD-binding oxidoreductase [Pseudalkalibacillus decolorationis]